MATAIALSWQEMSQPPSSSLLSTAHPQPRNPDTTQALSPPDHSLGAPHGLDIPPWFLNHASPHPPANIPWFSQSPNPAATKRRLLKEQHDRVIVVRRHSGGVYEEEFTGRIPPSMDMDTDTDYVVPASPRGRMLELLDEREMELSPPSPSRRSLTSLPDLAQDASILDSKRYILSPDRLCSSPPALSPPSPFHRPLTLLPEDISSSIFQGELSSPTLGLSPFHSSHALPHVYPPMMIPPTQTETVTQTSMDTIMDDCPELSPPSPMYSISAHSLAEEARATMPSPLGLGLGPLNSTESHDGDAASSSLLLAGTSAPALTASPSATNPVHNLHRSSSSISSQYGYLDLSYPHTRHPTLFSHYHPHTGSFLSFHHPALHVDALGSNLSTPSLLFSSSPHVLTPFHGCSQLHAEHVALLALRDKTVRDERANRERSKVLREYERIFGGLVNAKREQAHSPVEMMQHEQESTEHEDNNTEPSFDLDLDSHSSLECKPANFDDQNESLPSSSLCSPRLISGSLPELSDGGELCLGLSAQPQLISRTAGDELDGVLLQQDTDHDWGGGDETAVCETNADIPQQDLQNDDDSEEKAAHPVEPIYLGLVTPSQDDDGTLLGSSAGASSSLVPTSTSQSSCPPRPTMLLTPSSLPSMPFYRATATQIILERIGLKHKRKRDKERLRELRVILGVGVEALLELGERIGSGMLQTPPPPLSPMRVEGLGETPVSMGLGLGLGLVLDHQHQPPLEHPALLEDAQGDAAVSHDSDLSTRPAPQASIASDSESQSPATTRGHTPSVTQQPQQCYPALPPPRPSLAPPPTASSPSPSSSPSPPSVLSDQIARPLWVRRRAMSKLVARMAIRRREVAMRSLLEAGSLAEAGLCRRHSMVGDEQDIGVHAHAREGLDTQAIYDAQVEAAPWDAGATVPSYLGSRSPFRGSPLRNELVLCGENEDMEMMMMMTAGNDDVEAELDYVVEEEEDEEEEEEDGRPQTMDVEQRPGTFPGWPATSPLPCHFCLSPQQETERLN